MLYSMYTKTILRKVLSCCAPGDGETVVKTGWGVYYQKDDR